MSQAPAGAEESDEDHGSQIPEPPRRVPFGVVVTTALLGMLSLPLIMLTTVTLFSGEHYAVDVGEAALRGLGAAAAAVCAVLVVAVAWSFVRDGNTAGPMAVGLLVVVTGLILLGTGVAGGVPDAEELRMGVLALVLGLGVLLVPLLGHGPAYLAARRVWARAERDWLRDLTTPESPPPVHPQQWPGHYTPHPQGGGTSQPQYQPDPRHQPAHPPQPGYTTHPGQAAQTAHPSQPGYPAQYQYPPQQAQAWTDQHPQQYQAWPEATLPPWSGPQPQAEPFPAPPAEPFPTPPTQPFPGPPAQAEYTPRQAETTAARRDIPTAPAGTAPASTGSDAASTEGARSNATQTRETHPESSRASTENQPAPTPTPVLAPVPIAAAQQAPTEQIRPTDPMPPQNAPRP